jgi:hypothetical protein
MKSKERLSELPQIDKLRDHDRSPGFAITLLDEIMRYYTLNQIEAHTGISRRNLSYMKHNGINTYPMQLALELMAGRKVLA